MTQDEKICQFLDAAYPVLSDLSVRFDDAEINELTNVLVIRGYDLLSEEPIELPISLTAIDRWEGSSAALGILLSNAIASLEEPTEEVEIVTPEYLWQDTTMPQFEFDFSTLQFDLDHLDIGFGQVSNSNQYVLSNKPITIYLDSGLDHTFFNCQ